MFSIAPSRLLRSISPQLLALSLGLVACAPPTPPPDTPTPGSDSEAGQSGQESSKSLKIGTLLPLTGDLAQYGGPMQDGAMLALEQINQCGGVQGQPLALVTEDSQTEPSRGAAAMTKLAEVDRVFGVVGAASSAISTAAVDIAVRNQILQISPASTSPVFTERAKAGDFNGFWARTAPSDALQGPALAQVARDRGLQRVAVIAINNDYGNGLATAFIEAFTAQGGTITNTGEPVLYAPDAVTFEAEVGKAFADQPDAVVLVAYPETGSLVLKAAYSQGYLGQTQLLFTDGMKSNEIAALVGQNTAGEYLIAGAIGTAAQSGGPGLEAFLTTYRDRFDRDPQVYDPNTYDAVVLLALAAQFSGGAGTGLDPEALKTHLATVANAPGEPIADLCDALDLAAAGTDLDYQGASSSLDLNQWGDVAGNYEVWEVDETGAIESLEVITVQE
ncbi:MAG: ABC transporter substrate-binding protein [Prochlorothrix sp.]